MKKLAVFGLICASVCILCLGLSAQAADEARLLRFPDINGDLVVFVYAGDIWSVPASGGEARRLTSDLGLELFPKISPDGRWIAFSAEYSGTRQVYVMPSTGGVPKQLTYYNDIGVLPPRGGFDHQVLDWTPDSRKVLIKANRTPYGDRSGKYYLVSIDGGLETPLQIPEGSAATFSPDGKSLAYTPIMREFRTWKRYRGGRTQDVWVYDLAKDQARRITDYPGTDQHPIWFKDHIYFVSDRDLTLNIYSYDLKTAAVKKITTYTDYDVLGPRARRGSSPTRTAATSTSSTWPPNSLKGSRSGSISIIPTFCRALRTSRRTSAISTCRPRASGRLSKPGGKSSPSPKKRA